MATREGVYTNGNRGRGLQPSHQGALSVAMATGVGVYIRDNRGEVCREAAALDKNVMIKL